VDGERKLQEDVLGARFICEATPRRNDYRVWLADARDGLMPAPNTKVVTSYPNSTRNNSTNMSLIKATLAAINARDPTQLLVYT
jgi:hypothetical protein